jgi:hypothetical protein
VRPEPAVGELEFAAERRRRDHADLDGASSGTGR